MLIYFPVSKKDLELTNYLKNKQGKMKILWLTLSWLEKLTIFLDRFHIFSTYNFIFSFIFLAKLNNKKIETISWKPMSSIRIQNQLIFKVFYWSDFHKFNNAIESRKKNQIVRSHLSSIHLLKLKDGLSSNCDVILNTQMLFHFNSLKHLIVENRHFAFFRPLKKISFFSFFLSLKSIQ